MSRIAIIGGHGSVARHLARILTGEGGHRVSAIIRDPDQRADVEEDGSVPILLDVQTATVDELTEVLGGHDAVVWAAGAGGGDPDRTYAVDRDGAIRSMEAAARAGVARYVMVSYQGARPDHGVDPESSFFAYAEAKAAADEHLRGTDLAWTILGPGRLTDEPATAMIELGTDTEHGDVPRADVARVAAVALADPAAIGRTLAFNRGDTPIADAVASLG
jgi:uncharacterized protein YbjT (DUF2867 family)